MALSHLYESILKEMRDANGDAGEFYTPRPVVKFIIEMLYPKIGESVQDPAAGTGGFLVESLEHLKRQAKTVEDRITVQKSSISGGEAKPLPYLLCQMNLLLHGLEYPATDSGNSLRFPLNDITDEHRVDIIATNPPFGGAEEKGILNNFPPGMQTSETAMLFLQLIMKKLRRKKGRQRGGRAAVVIPNSTLFDGGISDRIKGKLLEDFNLHTIVRLGEGIFAPYTDIPSNILFFEQGEPTQTIWYYEVLPPGDRKKYSKTRPIQPEEFEPLKAWWKNRSEGGAAWKVRAKDVVKRNDAGQVIGVNLDVKNPNRKAEEEILQSILQKERRVLQLMEEIESIVF